MEKDSSQSEPKKTDEQRVKKLKEDMDKTIRRLKSLMTRAKKAQRNSSRIMRSEEVKAGQHSSIHSFL